MKFIQNELRMASNSDRNIREGTDARAAGHGQITLEMFERSSTLRCEPSRQSPETMK